MAWSPVKRLFIHSIGWWRCKIICEFAYHIGNLPMYYKYLNLMCRKYKTNLYGEPS